VLSMLPLDKIRRGESTYPFTDYFKGFEKIQAKKRRMRSATSRESSFG
jgi:hypothetical protein